MYSVVLHCHNVLSFCSFYCLLWLVYAFTVMHALVMRAPMKRNFQKCVLHMLTVIHFKKVISK